VVLLGAAEGIYVPPFDFPNKLWLLVNSSALFLNTYPWTYVGFRELIKADFAVLTDILCDKHLYEFNKLAASPMLTFS
tara:strand:- start:102 stop:335 length:234 start_codon:yes stop_codon:yes gene_type:complete